MASSPRPGEITYYEELGVENSASAEEIRDAFRALARLLHPDQQTDPQLKAMAERQMRKLNRIYSVLSDPTRRTAYDHALQSRAAPVIVFSDSDGNLRRLLVRAGTLGAIIFGSFLLIWFMVTSNNPEIRTPDVRNPSIAKTNDNSDVEAGDQISRLRDQLRAAETERDSALEQLGRMDPKRTESLRLAHAYDRRIAPPRETLLETTATALNEPSSTGPGSETADSDPSFKAARFAGLWVFAGDKGSASPGGQSQYRPEFIEMTMTEKDGALHGQ